MSKHTFFTKWVPGPDRLHLHFSTNRSDDNLVFGVESLSVDPNDMIRLRSLLEQKRTWTMPIQPSKRGIGLIENLMAGCTRQQQQYGGHACCIGYPTLHIQHRGDTTSIPLMLWQVDLLCDDESKWRITRTPKHDQFLNPYAVHWLVHFYPAIDTDLFERFDESQITRETLERLIHNIAHQANTSYLSSVEGLYQQNYPLPFFENLLIVQAATIGVYPATLWRSLIAQLPPILESAPWVATLPHVLDPDQSAAFREVLAGSAAVQGLPGTGKTHLARRLILESLAQGKRVLVVSPYLQTLTDYAQFLRTRALDRLTTLLADDQHQTPEMLLRLAQEVKAKPPRLTYQTAAYQLAINQLSRNTSQLNDTVESMRHRGLLGQSWSATVNRFLEVQEKESKEVLNNLLSPQDFEFTDDSWHTYRTQLEQLQPLLEKLGTLDHPLTHLNDRWFGENTVLDTSLEESRLLLDRAIDTLTDLHRSYLKHLDDYGNMLSGSQENKLRLFRSRISSTMALFADYESIYGQEFAGYGQETTLLKPLIEAFQSKKSDVAQAAKEVAEQYKELKALYQRHKIFDFDWLRDRDSESMPKVKENLIQFEASLQLWRRKVEAQIQEDIHRLNSKQTTGQLLFDKRTKDLEDQLDSTLDDINHQQILKERLSHRMLTLHTRRNYIEDILSRLILVRSGFTDFDNYYPFRQRLLQGGPAIQKLVAALARVRASNWLQAFESWFLYHFLAQNYDLRLSDDDLLMHQSLKKLLRIEEQVPGHIWAQQAGLRQLGAGGWHPTRNKTPDQSWLHTAPPLIQSDFNSFQAFFPVWLTTPRALFNMLSKSGNCTWDLLIAEQAEDIAVMDLEYLRSLTKHQLLIYAHNTPGAHLPIGTLTLRYDHLVQPPAITGLRRKIHNSSMSVVPWTKDLNDALEILPADNEPSIFIVQKLIHDAIKADSVPSTLLLLDSFKQFKQVTTHLAQIENDAAHPDHEAVKHMRKAGLHIGLIGDKALSTTQHVAIALADTTQTTDEHIAGAIAVAQNKLTIAYTAAWQTAMPTILNTLLNTATTGFSFDTAHTTPTPPYHAAGVERQLTRSLRGLVRPDRLIRSVVIGHTYYPLIIKPAYEGQPHQLVVIDDEIGQEDHAHHLWHFHRITLFEQAGWLVVRTWSAHWWRNASVEGRRIAGLILENDLRYKKPLQIGQEDTPESVLSDIEIQAQE